MSVFPSASSPVDRFAPVWASLLASIALLMAAGFLVLAVRFVVMFVSGEQYGILGLLGALVTVGLALFVGLPTLGYFRSRSRGLFVSSMVCAGLVAVGLVAFGLYATS